MKTRNKRVEKKRMFYIHVLLPLPFTQFISYGNRTYDHCFAGVITSNCMCHRMSIFKLKTIDENKLKIYKKPLQKYS